MKHKRNSGPVVLGEKYRDRQTGLEGHAVARVEFQYGCDRVTLEVLKPDKTLEELTFDAPRLERYDETGKPISTDDDTPGGPRSSPARRGLR